MHRCEIFFVLSNFTSVGSPFNLNPVQFTFPSSPPHCSSVQFISREFSSLQSPVQSILLWFISEEVNRGSVHLNMNWFMNRFIF